MPQNLAQTLEFCRRWVAKAQGYDQRSLEDVFDKYFTLFVAFNRLYSFVSNTPAWDKNSATKEFPRVVGHANLLQAILDDPQGEADVQTMADLIGPGGLFYLISVRGGERRDWQANAELHQRLTSQDVKTKIHAILEFLYLTRCNMFHGTKDFIPNQAELLSPATHILEIVVRTGMRELEEIN